MPKALARSKSHLLVHFKKMKMRTNLHRPVTGIGHGDAVVGLPALHSMGLLLSVFTWES
jgi:hypothetical protein